MKTYIDYFVNKITMYMLVFVCLCVLWAGAFVAAFFDVISISPLALVLSTTVLLGATFVANLLFGWLFGIKVHRTSALITAMILVFIVTPRSTVNGLFLLAVLGTVAMATKYILAVRGRHIFNPAAAGVFIVGLLGIVHATWWVATPPLVPLTAVLGLLVLHKLRKLRMGLLFAAVASVALVLSQVLLYDESVGRWVSMALLSWPTVFIAGFMLSEPLTTPPRRSQQLGIAVLVGLLCGIPLDITNDFSMTPQLALLIGNGVAFAYGQRGAIRLRLVSKRVVTDDVHEFIFKPRRKLNFTAGQYLEFTLPHHRMDLRGTRRMFSIASSPEAETVTIATRIGKQPSSFKRALSRLKLNQAITATMVSGDFVLPKQKEKPILMIAGGIGITPFLSHIAWLKQSHEKRDIHLIYLVRSVAGAAYLEELVDSDVQGTIVTDELGDKTKIAGWNHLRSVDFSTDKLREVIPDLSQRVVYVSGAPGMVDVWNKRAHAAGAKQVVTDHFSGY